MNVSIITDTSFLSVPRQNTKIFFHQVDKGSYVLLGKIGVTYDDPLKECEILLFVEGGLSEFDQLEILQTILEGFDEGSCNLRKGALNLA